MEDLFTVFPFWSVRLKSGAVSPTARLSWLVLDLEVDAGANADAVATKRVKRAVFAYMFDMKCDKCDFMKEERIGGNAVVDRLQAAGCRLQV